MTKLLKITFFWVWLCTQMWFSMVNPSSSSKGKGREEQVEKKRKVSKGKKAMETEEPSGRGNQPGDGDKGWTDSIMNRGVKCERQVDFRSEIFPRPVQMMMDRGMAFWMFDVEGYSLWMVREFYINMVYNDHHLRVESTVKGKKIVITPDTIATYLCYTRPVDPLLPMRPLGVEIIDQRIVRDTIVAQAGGWTGNHFVLGRLHMDYQLANKILHYNLLPKGTEKMPSPRAAELMYAFMQPDIVIDFALWIWMEIREFLTETSLRASMPFPAMITRLVRAELGGKYLKEELTPGNPGPITEASWKKAATHSLPRASSVSRPSSASRPSSSSYGAKFEPKEKKPGFKRLEEFLRAILCRQDDIVKSQKKLQKRVEFCMEAAATQLGASYESPPESEEEAQQEDPGEGDAEYGGGRGSSFGPGSYD